MAQEKNFENKIKRYITDRGGWCVKFFANGMTKRGIPDLLCCVNGHFLAIEVKADNGKPSDLQLYQIEQIKRAGGSAMVLYPKQWDAFKDYIDYLVNNPR